MNDLELYLRQNDKKLIYKLNYYFDIYDRYVSSFTGKEIAILEMEVFHNSSLHMLKDYFGKGAKIFFTLPKSCTNGLGA
jgi:hypothetical protein